ncbi:MAG: GFA family protein [Pseudomonadota bacterium]
MSQQSGQCLCGAVQVTADLADTIQACHCTQCQRWTGGGPLYAVRARNADVAGDAAIQSYQHSGWGERAFCANCGTTLYWKLQDRGIAFVAPGLFDDWAPEAVTEEIFVDTRPDWLPPHKGAAQHTAAEMKAQLDAFLNKGDRA